MASRRTVAGEKSVLQQDNRSTFRPDASKKSDITPAVPAAVIYKLLAFTAAMVAGPIGTYFLTLNLVFGGNSTFAGATAAIMANVVLVAYVIVAMKEDQSERMAADAKAKKGE
ncbi:MAG: hypothetical protein LQ347_003370 [Umbilicaria vellea]|nr:MAG: hypothetical protein LQ347_003370 [Umbilicaria vellea]